MKSYTSKFEIGQQVYCVSDCFPDKRIQVEPDYKFKEENNLTLRIGKFFINSIIIHKDGVQYKLQFEKEFLETYDRLFSDEDIYETLEEAVNIFKQTLKILINN